MSGQGNGQSRVYTIRISEQNRALLKQRHLEAVQWGKGKQFLDALRRIFERLRQAPLDFGEPVYRLPSLNLLVRQAVVLPLVVDFGVHEERPFVFIRGFKVLG